MRIWAQRGLFVTLILGGAAFKFAGNAAPTSEQFIARVDGVLMRSGFRVAAHTPSWRNGEIKGTPSRIARHPDCGQAITVTPVALMAPIGGAESGAESGGGSVQYVYGDLQERAPSRLAVAGETVRLELTWIASLGRALRPQREMLAVRDPSACLALTSAGWKTIWTGSGG